MSEIIESDLAYIAGIIDGEGCITIQRSKKKRCNAASYQAHIIVCMTSEAVIKHLVDKVPGGWMTTQHKANGNRTLYRFVVTGNSAYVLAEQLMPYLVEKKNQALKLLELKPYGKGQGYRSTQTELDEKQVIFNELKAMHL